jgi:hypothetical protein
MERTDAHPTSTDTPPADWLKRAALTFAVVASTSAEYQLAARCGFGYVAAAVPGALDTYVIRALRVHRDVAPAVLAMIAVNAVSHLVTAGLLPVGPALVVLVAAIAPLVLWRVHTLRAPATPAEQTPALVPATIEQPAPATTAEPPEPVDVAPVALPVAAQVTPLIVVQPGASLKDHVLAAATVLGDTATSPEIAAALNAQHGLGTNAERVRAVLSRHKREQEQQAAQQAQQEQQPEQWVGGYA